MTAHRPQQPALVPAPRVPTVAPWTTVIDDLETLAEQWSRPDPFIPTGVRQLDAMLGGGIRPGDLIGVAGAAGGGKSILVGQIALNAARAGAAVVYASVEMTAHEIVSRWLALEAFRASDPRGTDWSLGFADVLYGRAFRGEGISDATTRAKVLQRLETARMSIAQVGSRIVVRQVAPGSTVETLRWLVDETRKRTQAAHLVLLVDPIQRLFASEQGGRRGRAADAVNATEVERCGAVAQELKYLSDQDGVAVMFTSDTTKAAAMGAQSSVGSLRGSYQLNHHATMVLGLHGAATPEDLRARLDGRSKDAEPIAPEITVECMTRSLPMWWGDRRDANSLGPRVGLLECSKNRRGACRHAVLGLVLGAACVVEGEPNDDPNPQDPEARTTHESLRPRSTTRRPRHRAEDHEEPTP
jgi:RecA/RadA recombinase